MENLGLLGTITKLIDFVLEFLVKDSQKAIWGMILHVDGSAAHDKR